MNKTSVILADDHAILRYGLRIYLSKLKHIEIAGEASTGDECVALFKEKRPDVCVLDLEMPGKNGIEVTHAIRSIEPEAKILILTMHSNGEMMRQAMASGIHGYLIKDTPKETIAEAITNIHNGKRTFCDAVTNLNEPQNDNHREASCQANITNREREILHWVVEGYSSPQIADKLYISPRTVDTHRNNLMKKLDIKNAASLVRYALKHDMLEDLPTFPSSTP